MKRATRLAALIVFALNTVTADAQDAPATTTPEGVIYPAEPGGYGASAYHAQNLPPDSPWDLNTRQKYPLKVDLNVEVPIPVTDDNDSANPGVGLSAMFGWDLGFLVPTANVGWSWNGLNLPNSYNSDRSLTRLHMGIGLIAEFENKSVVTPVLGAMMDFNWWHVTGDVSLACGGIYYWGCYAVDDYDYSTGFTFKAGADFKFKRNDRFTLGTGVMPSVTLADGPFRQTEWWVSPYLAFTIRR